MIFHLFRVINGVWYKIVTLNTLLPSDSKIQQSKNVYYIFVSNSKLIKIESRDQRKFV